MVPSPQVHHHSLKKDKRGVGSMHLNRHGRGGVQQVCLGHAKRCQKTDHAVAALPDNLIGQGVHLRTDVLNIAGVQVRGCELPRVLVRIGFGCCVQDSLQVGKIGTANTLHEFCTTRVLAKSGHTSKKMQGPPHLLWHP